MAQIAQSTSELDKNLLDIDLEKLKLTDPTVDEMIEIKDKLLTKLTEDIFNDQQFNVLYQELEAQGFTLIKEEITALNIIATYKNKLTQKNETFNTITATLPLINDKQEEAIISYVSNKFGVGCAAIIINPDKEKTTLLIPKAISDENITADMCDYFTECNICFEVAKKLLNLAQIISCQIACVGPCLFLSECPVALAVCGVICKATCQYLTRYPDTEADARELCMNHGYCPDIE